jgi:hypothetical protein
MTVAGSDPFYAGPVCPRCQRGFADGIPDGTVRCHRCLAEFEATRFNPAPLAARVARIATAGPEGATACPQHPGNAAVGHCERCGILTCSLCQIEADRMLLCPACFERLSDDGTLASTRVQFRDHPRLAATLALLGLLVFVTGALTGPAVIWYALHAQRSAKAVDAPASGWRLAVVIFLGLAQFIGSLWLIRVMTSADS